MMILRKVLFLVIATALAFTTAADPFDCPSLTSCYDCSSTLGCLWCAPPNVAGTCVVSDDTACPRYSKTLQECQPEYCEETTTLNVYKAYEVQFNSTCTTNGTVAESYCEQFGDGISCLLHTKNPDVVCSWNETASLCTYAPEKQSTFVSLNLTDTTCPSCMRLFGANMFNLTLSPKNATGSLFDPVTGVCTLYRSFLSAIIINTTSPLQITNFQDCFVKTTPTSSATALRAMIGNYEVPQPNTNSVLGNLIPILIPIIAGVLLIIGFFQLMPFPVFIPLRKRIASLLSILDYSTKLREITPEPGQPLNEPKAAPGGYVTLGLVLGICFYIIYAMDLSYGISKTTFYSTIDQPQYFTPSQPITAIIGLYNTSCADVIINANYNPPATKCNVQANDGYQNISMCFVAKVVVPLPGETTDFVITHATALPKDFLFYATGNAAYVDRSSNSGYLTNILTFSSCAFLDPAAILAVGNPITANSRFVVADTYIHCGSACRFGSARFAGPTSGTYDWNVEVPTLLKSQCTFNPDTDPSCSNMIPSFPSPPIQTFNSTTLQRPSLRFTFPVSSSRKNVYVSAPSQVSVYLGIVSFIGSIIGLNGIIRLIVKYISERRIMRGSVFGLILPILPVLAPLRVYYHIDAIFGVIMGASVVPYALWLALVIASSTYSIDLSYAPQNLLLFMPPLIQISAIAYWREKRNVIAELGRVSQLISGFFVGLIPFFGVIFAFGSGDSTVFSECGVLVGSMTIIIFMRGTEASSEVQALLGKSSDAFLNMYTSINVFGEYIALAVTVLVFGLLHYMIATKQRRARGDVKTAWFGVLAGLFLPFIAPYTAMILTVFNVRFVEGACVGTIAAVCLTQFIPLFTSGPLTNFAAYYIPFPVRFTLVFLVVLLLVPLLIRNSAAIRKKFGTVAQFFIGYLIGLALPAFSILIYDSSLLAELGTLLGSLSWGVIAVVVIGFESPLSPTKPGGTFPLSEGMVFAGISGACAFFIILVIPLIYGIGAKEKDAPVAPSMSLQESLLAKEKYSYEENETAADFQDKL